MRAKVSHSPTSGPIVSDLSNSPSRAAFVELHLSNTETNDDFAQPASAYILRLLRTNT